MERRTLIFLKRELTDPKAALAGVMLEVSSAESRVSMPASNVERVLSRPSGSREFVAIVEALGSREGVVWSKAARRIPNTLAGR
jgi:thymidine phosphorylase